MPFIHREVPPDLYVFSSWHYVRAYREAYLADDVWKSLLEVASVADLKHHMDNPSKIHIPIHEAVRKIFKLRPYEDHSPFWEPKPDFVAETLKGFLSFYFGSRPQLVEEASSLTAEKQSEKQAEIPDSKPDESEIIHLHKDANIAKNEIVQDSTGDTPTPPALKGEVDKEMKRKPGRPKAANTKVMV